MFVKAIHLCTKTYVEMTVITPLVEDIVAESRIRNGMVTVQTKHTTTGITVNEALECLESDIQYALSTRGYSPITEAPREIRRGISKRC